MNFFIAIDPPTSTAQMKQVRVVKGKPIFYDPPAVKEARNVLSAQHSDPTITVVLPTARLWQVADSGRDYVRV